MTTTMHITCKCHDYLHENALSCGNASCRNVTCCENATSHVNPKSHDLSWENATSCLIEINFSQETIDLNAKYCVVPFVYTCVKVKL